MSTSLCHPVALNALLNWQHSVNQGYGAIDADVNLNHLHTANVYAYMACYPVSRYPDHTWENLYIPNLEYHWDNKARNLTAIEALKLCQYVRHQCIDWPNYKGSWAQKIIDLTFYLAITNLPGYEEATWGYEAPTHTVETISY